MSDLDVSTNGVRRLILRDEVGDGRTPFPLGRHVEHDPRSRAFAARLALPRDQLRDVRWPRNVGIYDQGELGACTLEAALGSVSTRPFRRHFRSQLIIRRYYSETTHRDEFPGAWPPDDTGSSGLAAAQTLQRHRIITAYRHLFTLDDALGATQVGPFMTGIRWFWGMFRPDGDGRIHYGDGGEAGGHELVTAGFQRPNRVWFANSWSAGWGIDGYCYMTIGDYERALAEDGDATVLVA